MQQESKGKTKTEDNDKNEVRRLTTDDAKMECGCDKKGVCKQALEAPFQLVSAGKKGARLRRQNGDVACPVDVL